jgi:aquaporin Z
MTDRKLKDYCYEALGLGIFMFSAGLFDVIIDHPDLPVRQHISSAFIRRFLIGLSMGLTALFIFNAPFGKKSGAYINPAVTLVQYRLGNIDKKDAFFYALFQFIGGSLGMYAIYLFLPALISHPAINYIVTVPGSAGIAIAFFLELMISFLLILVVLFTSNSKQFSTYTPYIVALLITLYISFEAPYSGMSMNPARSFASAIVANQWKDFWLYCTAPVTGMLAGQLLFSWKTKRYLITKTVNEQ